MCLTGSGRRPNLQANGDLSTAEQWHETFDGTTDLSITAIHRIALEFGADLVGGVLSEAEQRLVRAASQLPPSPASLLKSIHAAIERGDDPLGDAFLANSRMEHRRRLGAFYTPAAIVQAMLDWALRSSIGRVVDAGCGSGRFALAAARRDGVLEVIAIDIDPMATLITRANASILGLSTINVVNASYQKWRPNACERRTAYVGNPPYVRHHSLSAESKEWAKAAGRELGVAVSALAGLHAHFFLSTALNVRHGDVGSFITSAEWLDVNYGSVIRSLLIERLGLSSLHLLDSSIPAFEKVMTTAVITCFEVGRTGQSIEMLSARDLNELRALDRPGMTLGRKQLSLEQRWTSFPRSVRSERGLRRLGDLARVHRGAVTGANDFFIMTRERARELRLIDWCYPAITSAKEILESEGLVRDDASRKVVLDPDRHLERLEHPALDSYLRLGEQNGGSSPPVNQRYVTRNRRPWWRVAMGRPPIVASYMARRPPAFALNPDGLGIVNVAHGIYPLVPMSAAELAELVDCLNKSSLSFRGRGRTYHGGLEKFEPREMEDLRFEWPEQKLG